MWLLEAVIKNKILKAEAAGWLPSAAQQTVFDGQCQVAQPDILTIVGDTAHIEVEGVLTKDRDFLAFFFGGGNTTYTDIQTSLHVAENDKNVKKAILNINSPGGSVKGLFDTLAALQDFSKPLDAIISDQAASAAFAIASQADTITATNQAAMVGSVGIVASIQVFDNVVDISSTDAPDKRPDVTTEEGRAVVRKQLDALHELFVEAIAEGRKTTVENVNKNFGQGGILIARDAVKMGMIDSIGVKVNVNSKGGEKAMDLNELKANHRELHDSVVGIGIAQERDRVSAHLVMGEKSGAMVEAVKAVKEGTEMTATMQAVYMSAGMDKRDIDTRQGDANALDKIVAGAADEKSKEDVVADLVCKELEGGIN